MDFVYLERLKKEALEHCGVLESRKEETVKLINELFKGNPLEIVKRKDAKKAAGIISDPIEKPIEKTAPKPIQKKEEFNYTILINNALLLLLLVIHLTNLTEFFFHQLSPLLSSKSFSLSFSDSE